MHRTCAPLRGHLAALAVLWAVVVAGAGVVPAPAWPAAPGSAAQAWMLDTPSGEGNVVAVRLLAQPLIAELPGRAGGTSSLGSFEVPVGRAVPDLGLGYERRGDGAGRAVSAWGAEEAPGSVVSGAERCRRFCVYRL